MVKKGPMSQNDKYIIQAMLHDKKEVEEIAKQVNRSPESVAKYVSGELERIQTAVAKKQYEETKPQKEEKPFVPTSNEVAKDAIQLVRNEGFNYGDAKALVDKALKLAAKKQKRFKDANRLRGVALKGITAKNVMIRKTQGGRDGVAIATAAAMARGDKIRENPGKATRRTEGNIWKIREEEFE